MPVESFYIHIWTDLKMGNPKLFEFLKYLNYFLSYDPIYAPLPRPATTKLAVLFPFNYRREFFNYLCAVIDPTVKFAPNFFNQIEPNKYGGLVHTEIVCET